MYSKGKKTLKARLDEGEAVFGTFMKLNAPSVAEMLGLAGFDFVIIDGEHGNYSYNEMQMMVMAANHVGMDAIIRVANDLEQNMLHAADMGSQGVQVPNLKSAAQASEAAAKMRYYPMGTRGLSLSTRGARYNFCDAATYIHHANNNVACVIMIENAEIANEIPALCADPNIDILFIGTSDLSQSMGVPGQAQSPLVQSKIQEITNQILAGGKHAGIIAFSPAEAQRYMSWGIRYIAYGTEGNMICDKFKEVTKSLHEIIMPAYVD